MRAVLALSLLFPICWAATYHVYVGYDVDGTQHGNAELSGWTLMDFWPNSITVQQGDSVSIDTMGFAHLVFFSPGGVPPSFFDGPTLTYVPPTYQGPGSAIIDPNTVYSAGPMWAGDKFAFSFPTVGVWQGACGYHPAMKITVTVIAGAAPQTPAQIDTSRTTAINAAIAQLPPIDRTVTPPSTTSGGATTYTILVGSSQSNPKASYLGIIPANPAIQPGDTLFFKANDNLNFLPLCINSTNNFLPTNPLVGGTTLETMATAPGGRMIEQFAYLLPAKGNGGDFTNYKSGWVTSGWMGTPSFPAIPGIGKLPYNWTITFTAEGTYYWRHILSGWCPSYTGPACHSAIGNGKITVASPPPPSPVPSASATMFLSVFTLIPALVAYFL